NHHFTGSVESIHVRCRISFSKTQFLRFLQGIFITLSLLVHLCQNVIRCSVNNAHHLLNSVRNEPVRKTTKQWDTSANTCFIEQVTSIFKCDSFQLWTMKCNQIFVRSDNMLFSL